jgi:hypothetical protein
MAGAPVTHGRRASERWGDGAAGGALSLCFLAASLLRSHLRLHPFEGGEFGGDLAGGGHG